MITEINTLSDVEVFAKKLISEGTSFHPDDDFTQYVKQDNNQKAYTAEESVLRNNLMGRCFSVCAENGVDIYDFMLDIYLRETRLDKFIPDPLKKIK